MCRGSVSSHHERRLLARPGGGGRRGVTTATMSTLFDGVLFPQSLQDLVKGIRAHRRDEAAYIRGKIAEITSECRASEPHKKANGVLKLTYVRYHVGRLGRFVGVRGPA